jgi:hypothetical protein
MSFVEKGFTGWKLRGDGMGHGETEVQEGPEYIFANYSKQEILAGK